MSVLAHAGTSPWAWHAHPDVWSLVAVLAVGYWLALTRLGPSHVSPGEKVASRFQVVSFALGVAALWLHADYPIHDVGEGYLFSVHMFQHIGFTLIAAPLLLLGLPSWLVRWLVQPRAVHWLVSRLARPLPAAVVFNTVVVLTHWPVVMNASLRYHGVHLVVHMVIFTSALLMWFPVLNRVPELPTMGHPARMVYLFLQSVIPTVPASFLTFGRGVMYRFYAEAPRAFPFSAIDDQQLGGALMKVYAGALLWVAIGVIFFRWYSGEQRDRAPDVLTWDDVERELQRTEPAPPPRRTGSGRR
ncbi:MAG: cytochrome c oxidase assembly protein [Actinomycetota bacterium]|nr:cytochrome c oxidase assembly protein [Actinomycetota bacterium]